MIKTNSAGTAFEAIARKDHAPFGEHWIQVNRPNGVTEGIGQFGDSFDGQDEAVAWIDQHMEDVNYL